jgi:hypothetical protein
MAQPFKRRFPISAEAVSDCWRRLALSSVSAGSANVGELNELDTSVAGVEGCETWELDDTLGEDRTRGLGIGLRLFEFDAAAREEESRDCYSI